VTSEIFSVQNADLNFPCSLAARNMYFVMFVLSMLRGADCGSLDMLNVNMMQTGSSDA